MGEIGLGQFIKNVFDYSTGKPVQSQPGKVANENFQKAQNEMVKAINQTAKNIAENFVRQHDIINTQMQLKELSSAERSALMKQFFDFPNDIKDLMKFLITDGKNTVSAKELNMLMTQNIDLSKLIQLLQTNGKIANEKLAKMTATLNQSGIYDTKQIKELAVLVNACIPASDAPQAQVLKNLLAMYLPWLPSQESVSFDAGSEEDKDGKSAASEDVITIIITTKNYGIVKILLYKEQEGFNLDISCSSEFPKEMFNESLKGESFSANTVFTTRKSADKSEEAKVEFSKSEKISPQLLIVVHSVIKLIMEIDQKGSLNETRKNML
jgi:hypothetical protein